VQVNAVSSTFDEQSSFQGCSASEQVEGAQYSAKGRNAMPDKSTTERAKEDLREGKSPSTAAGEFVHEEIEHVREGKHGARSPQQAIAIGLSKARRAGIPLKPPAKGRTKESTRKSAERAYEKGQSGEAEEPSARASLAREKALQREPQATASHRSLSAQSRAASRRRSKGERHAAAMEAVQTKGKAGLQRAAKKAARTRTTSR
jgi:hypothetical protein